MKNSNKKKYLKVSPWLVILFCFLMYPPTIKTWPMGLEVIALIIPIVYIVLNWRLFLIIERRHFLLILGIMFLILLSCLYPSVHGTNDFSYLYASTYFFRKVVVYLFMINVIIKKHGTEKLSYYFLYYFCLIHAFYVIGTIILVLVPQIQNLWFSIFSKEVSSESLFESYGYTFRLGWQGFAGFRLTLYCTFSVIFVLYLMYGNNAKVINGRQFAFVFLACILGNMFYGRSGIVVSVIVSIIGIIYWNRNRIKRLLRFAALPLILILALILMKDVPVFNSWYTWMSTPFKNLVLTGELNNKSFDNLQEMRNIEIEANDVAFGKGMYFEDGHYYMNTDIGFMRNILFWGIFGAVCSYGLTLYSIFGLRKVSRMMALQFLISFLVFEYKGAVYYEFIPLLFAAEMAYYYSNRQDLAAVNTRGIENRNTLAVQDGGE